MFLDDYDSPPWLALVYLTGECNYGGRVTDTHDRRLIISMLQTLYCKQTVDDDDYKFSASGYYYAPKDGPYTSYLDYIRSLPMTQHPEVGF